MPGQKKSDGQDSFLQCFPAGNQQVPSGGQPCSRRMASASVWPTWTIPHRHSISSSVCRKQQGIASPWPTHGWALPGVEQAASQVTPQGVQGTGGGVFLALLDLEPGVDAQGPAQRNGFGSARRCPAGSVPDSRAPVMIRYGQPRSLQPLRSRPPATRSQPTQVILSCQVGYNELQRAGCSASWPATGQSTASGVADKGGCWRSISAIARRYCASSVVSSTRA